MFSLSMSAKSDSKTLVIVESPAKATTIEKYLGKGHKVVSSFGHIRDLPKSKMGIDIDNNYEPGYITPKDKSKVARELKAEAKNATEVILATDEDREGEAIAWHVAHLLELDPAKTKRIVFHEITEEAIKSAIANPRTIKTNLVDAQQARRILDRLVGYELSPMLWKKVRRGLSAGRVQSVAVRLVAEREQEIEKQEEQRHFKLIADLNGNDTDFEAKLQLKEQVEAEKYLINLAKNQLTVASVKQTPSTSKAPAPFTTSTLQQTAASRLKMSVKQTMMLAQRLYESGHITYMRTDSRNLSSLAVASIKSLISSKYGENYVGEGAFASAKGAQEAHEAIRPTNVISEVAGNDERQKKLYQLIRNRTIASQMVDAKLEKTDIEISSEQEKNLIAKGVIVKFPGYMVADSGSATKESVLPDLNEGDEVKLNQAVALQQSKKPPARYSEATLVKTLEKLGIGRPSTYAPTISTVQDRGYVEKRDVEGVQTEYLKLSISPGADVAAEKVEEMYGSERNKLIPTDIGLLVNKFLTEHFKDIVDFDFTANIEKSFDRIADGEMQWQNMIDDFYKPFHSHLEEIDKTVSKSDTGSVKELGNDPETGEMIYARFARFGPVIQIGEGDKEKDIKPRFAPFPKGKTIENITIDDALKMMELPRVVGQTDEGQDIEVSIGRFGPYIKVDKSYVSIEDDQVFSIDLSEAKKLIKEGDDKKKKALIQEFPDKKLVIKTGRFGPYVTDGKLNASIPKKIDPAEITEVEALELLEKKKKKSTKK